MIHLANNGVYDLQVSADYERLFLNDDLIISDVGTGVTSVRARNINSNKRASPFVEKNILIYRQLSAPLKNSVKTPKIPINISPYLTSIVSNLFFDGSMPKDGKGAYYNQKNEQINDITILQSFFINIVSPLEQTSAYLKLSSSHYLRVMSVSLKQTTITTIEISPTPIYIYCLLI